MSFDPITLVIAKKYTDEQIKQNSTGGVDLSGYYTREEIDAMNFVTSDELPEGGMVDKTLTIEGQAADAKATGDRLLSVEYQTIVTDEAYEHKDLPECEKTVIISGDGAWGDTAYVCTGEDLIPRKTFNKTFPHNGITITRNEKIYHIEGTTPTNTGVNFGQTQSDINIEFDENISGKKFKLITCSNKVIGNYLRAGVRFYASDNSVVQVLNKYGALANQIVLGVGNTTLTSEVEFTIPDGVNIAYMRPYLDILTGTTFDSDFQFFMVEAENVYNVIDGAATIEKNRCC